MLVADRDMPIDGWRAHYVDHPLLGQMARRLIWQFRDGSQTALGALIDGQIVDVGDRPLSWLSSSTTVRFWHPIGEPRELVHAWRRWLDRHAVVQPFKQAHREVYRVAVDDQTTRTYSSRFAAHILRQHQLVALCRERGWRYLLQGDWDSANNPTCRLPRWNLRVEFEVERPDDLRTIGSSGAFEFVTTGHVWFSRDGVRLPLTEVPALAFSEAMRDVDLFVSVCGAGYDPTWVDRPPPPTFQEYWLKLLGSPLSESAEIRRAVLEDVIPRLTIADQLTLEDGFLVVRGALGTYRIHLGSALVVREPGAEYVSLVPDRRADAGRNVRIPFEGDVLLVTILIKAFMLADDPRDRRVGRAGKAAG